MLWQFGGGDGLIAAFERLIHPIFIVRTTRVRKIIANLLLKYS